MIFEKKRKDGRIFDEEGLSLGFILFSGFVLFFFWFFFWFIGGRGGKAVRVIGDVGEFGGILFCVLCLCLDFVRGDPLEGFFKKNSERDL